MGKISSIAITTLSEVMKLSPIVPPIQVTNPPKQLVTMKLDETYFSWKHQVLIVIKGYGIANFISEAMIPPSEFLKEGGTKGINPAYIVFERQDNLLVSWLLASISLGMLSQLIRCDRAK